MKIITKSLALYTVVAILSCNSKDNKQSSKDSINNQVSMSLDEQIDSLTAELDSIDIDSNKVAKGRGKGRTWREWERMFKACMQTEWIRKPFYYGPTNTITLGAIVTDNFDRIDWQLSDILPDSTIKTITNVGRSADCAEQRKSKMNLEALLEGEMKDVGDAELGGIIEKANSVTTAIKGFQVDNLVIGPFKNTLKVAPTEIKQQYIDNLKQGYLLLNKVMKVSSFTTTINLKARIEGNLSGELRQGRIIKFGDAGVKARFNYDGDKTLTVTSTGPFVVFAKFLKAEEIY